jgi:NhaA family Na+:H+ antiporter
MANQRISPSLASASGLRARTGAAGWRFVTDRFLLLPAGAAIALVWANVAPESYFEMAFRLSFAVNEIAMAFFLALMALEVSESLMPGGALHHWRRWSLALVAAGGGVAGAVGVFMLYVQLEHETVLSAGWPVACAVDLAAGYYVLKLIWRRGSALPFLLLIAVATNVIGLLVVTLRSPIGNIDPLGMGLLVTAVAIAALLRKAAVSRFSPYLLCGAVAWYGLYLAGVHPALALVPIVPFLPREPRRHDLFADPPDDDHTHHVEREWNQVVQVILFLFGLVNAGVILRAYDTGTWAMLTSALIGRPVGIIVAVGLATAAGLSLPHRIGWRDVVVIALATSSGFTFALFFATGALPPGSVLSQIKLGALLSVAGAGLAIVMARALGVGRFAIGRRAASQSH